MSFYLLQIISFYENLISLFLVYRCNSAERIKRIKSWQKNGGVFIIGYRMFQDMYKNIRIRSNASEYDIFRKAFINPGADLVVCDEGHLLKNPSSQLSLALNSVHTLRRIILTGTPLQNNLKECKSISQYYTNS